MKNTLIALAIAIIATMNVLFAETARVQVIHNSADAAAEVVDVWLNDTKLLDDFTFRTASPFIDAPAGEEFTIAIKGSDSQDPENPIWAQNYTLTEGNTYILVAEGIVSPSGYDPATPFDIAVYDMGRESASASGDTDILVHHGSTDAPTVDVVEVGVGYSTVVDDISYGEFDGYLELPTSDDYLLNLFEPQFGTFATYEAPLSSLGLGGAAITVVASGFLNPKNNSNGEEFGLWVALASGGDLVELSLIPPTPMANFQVIHNSADAEAAMVDVWLDDFLAFDNLPFRFATPQFGVKAGKEFTISITDPNSHDANDPIWSNTYILEEDNLYIMVAEGIVSSSGYDPIVPFDLAVYDMARVYSNLPDKTDILVHHGSTDAPTVDIYEVGIGAGLIVDDLMYGDYAGYLELEAKDYILEIRDETGTNTVARYEAPLETYDINGIALTILASGFLNPENNSNGSAFGLWVALPSGGPLLELPVKNMQETAKVQVIHNSALPAAAEVDVYINGAKPEILDNFAFRAATPYVELPAGEDIIVTIALPTSMNADDQKIVDFNLGKLEQGMEYVIMANGILGDGFANPDMARDINFNLYPMAGRTSAMDDKMVDVNVFHGVTDAPAVDVYADMNADALISNLDYVQSTGYVSLPAADYDLTVTVAGNKDVVAGVFDADISGLAGGAAVVFASGFLTPDGQGTEVPMNYGFVLFAALPDGTVIELPKQNTASVDDYGYYESKVNIVPIPVTDSFYVLTDEVMLKDIELYDLNGMMIRRQTSQSNNEMKVSIDDLSAGYYMVIVNSDKGRIAKSLIVE